MRDAQPPQPQTVTIETVRQIAFAFPESRKEPCSSSLPFT